MPFYSGAITDTKLSADGTRLFVVSGSNVIVFNTATGALVSSYALGHILGAFDLSPDERYLVVVAPISLSSTSALFDRIDLQTGAIEHFSIPLSGSLSSSFYDVAYLSNGNILLSQASSNNLVEYDFDDASLLFHVGAGSGAILVSNADHSIAYMMDNTALVRTSVFVVGTGVVATQVDIPDPYAGAAVPNPGPPVVAVSADGTVFVQGYRLYVRDATLGAITMLDGIYTSARGLAFSPTGDKLYLLNATGQIIVFNTATWQPTVVFNTGVSPMSGSAFGDILDISANGQRISVLGAAGIELFTVANLTPVATDGDDIIIRDGVLYGLGGNDFLDSTNGSAMYGGPGNDTYFIRSSSQVIEQAGHGYDLAQIGISTYWLLPANIEEAVVTTTAGSFVVGSNGDNRMTGNEGSDEFRAASGSDILLGLAGDDLLHGQDGNDTIDGGDGADLVAGGSGADTLNGGNGDDILVSSEANYVGNPGADDSQNEFDTLVGGEGNDIVWMGIGDSADGGSGFDQLNISLQGSTAGAVINTGDFLGADPYVFAGGTIINFEALTRFFATNFADIITISALHGSIPILAGGGDDTILFNAVSITSPAPTIYGQIDGGIGSDTIDLTGIGPVTIGTLSSAPGQFQFGMYVGSQGYLLTGVETIRLGSADNYVDTTKAATGVTVLGGAGNENFVIAGATHSFGEEGDDTFFVSRSDYYPYVAGSVDGGAGINTLRTNIFFAVNLATGRATSGGVLYYEVHNIQNVELAAVSGVGSSATGDGADNVLSVNPLFDDGSVGVTLNGGGGNDELRGSLGNDLLDGGSGANLVLGRAGNDRLTLSSGADGSALDGGIGTDTLVVNATTNSLVGLAGIEAIQMSGGSNLTLTGIQFANGLANNTTVSGTGLITVNMSTGVNFLSQQFVFSGTGVTVVVNGTSGGDTMKLGKTSHIVNAGDGNDQIRGGTAADTINGGTGNDKIIGFTGADVITGGTGNDQFRYLFDTDSGTGASADRITDFVIGEDRLNFALLDTNAGLAGVQGFAFVGNGAFSGGGAASIRYTDSGADLLVQCDVNGDGVADMEIILQGRAGGTLTGADFIL